MEMQSTEGEFMWAKMSRIGFLLLALSLSPLLVLLLMTSDTKLDLLTVLSFDLLPVPFLAIGGLLEMRDPLPFVSASLFIPSASFLITVTEGVFQVIGIVIVASLLISTFSHELGHKASYREGYYVTILLMLALSMHSKVSLVLLGGIIVMHIAVTGPGIQLEAITFNGLFAVAACEFIKLQLQSSWRFCGIAWIVALLYSGLTFIILSKKHHLRDEVARLNQEVSELREEIREGGQK